jgi:hypothetical protein
VVGDDALEAAGCNLRRQVLEAGEGKRRRIRSDGAAPVDELQVARRGIIESKARTLPPKNGVLANEEQFAYGPMAEANRHRAESG